MRARAGESAAAQTPLPVATAVKPGTIKLSMEEGTQSEWLHQVLSPHVEQVVVTRVTEKTGAPGQKNDERDAYDLADHHRRDALSTAVWKDAGKLTTLRQLVKVHTSIVRDTVRAQNRIKALFRSRGVNVAGTSSRRRCGARLGNLTYMSSMAYLF